MFLSRESYISVKMGFMTNLGSLISLMMITHFGNAFFTHYTLKILSHQTLKQRNCVDCCLVSYFAFQLLSYCCDIQYIYFEK